MMAWISSVIGRSGSLRNAWRRTKGNYLRFLAVVFLFNAAAYLVQEADVLSGADSWLAWTLLAPLIIYCNVFLAKSFDFFFWIWIPNNCCRNVKLSAESAGAVAFPDES